MVAKCPFSDISGLLGRFYSEFSFQDCSCVACIKAIIDSWAKSLF